MDQFFPYDSPHERPHLSQQKHNCQQPQVPSGSAGGCLLHHGRLSRYGSSLAEYCLYATSVQLQCNELTPFAVLRPACPSPTQLDECFSQLSICTSKGQESTSSLSSFHYISSLGSDPGRKIEGIHRIKVTVPQARNHPTDLQYLTGDCPDASLRLSLPSVSCSPCATLPRRFQGELFQEIDRVIRSFAP